MIMMIIIIIMYIYHAVINALSAHRIHINLSIIFYTHVEYNPTKDSLHEAFFFFLFFFFFLLFQCFSVSY